MKKSIVIIAFLFLMSGCDFLEEEPIGLPHQDEFYGNINELQLGLNAVYNVLTTGNFQKNYAYIGSGCSDNMVTVQDRRLSEEATLFSLRSSPLDIYLRRFWFSNYLGIYRANLVIESAKLVRTFDAVNIENSRRKVREIVGEAKALRAFFYFNLVRTFGGVPIKETVLSVDGTNDNFKQPRATKEEVYQIVEKDLREAIIALDEFWSKGTVVSFLGRVDRGMAWSLLLKVLVYQSEPGIPSQKWAQALEVSSHIVDRQTATFTASDILNFSDLYQGDEQELARVKVDLLADTLSNEAFLRDVTAGMKSNFYDLDFNYALLNTEAADFSNESVFEVNQTIAPDGSVNLFSPFHNDINHSNLLQPFGDLSSNYPNDPRSLIAVMLSGDELIDGTGVGNPPFPEKTATYKWYTLNTERKKIKNFRIMRYAEVVLFHAEALNENGQEGRAIEVLNLLRARARRIVEAGDPRVTSSSTPADYGISNYILTRDRIRRDRRIELCFEFDRFWDIVRSGTAEENFARYNNNIEAEYRKNFRPGISEVFPIPIEEIDASGGLVIQNPGY